MAKLPKAEVSQIIAALYGPQLEEDHGMTWDEVAAYVGEHGHLPPLASGLFAGALPCGPFHFGCDHTCKEHRL